MKKGSNLVVDEKDIIELTRILVDDEAEMVDWLFFGTTLKENSVNCSNERVVMIQLPDEGITYISGDNFLP